MKLQSKKAIAVALAMTMCIPATAFGEVATDSNGTFNTDFDIYSPTLSVSVPLDANIRVNPIVPASGDTSVKQFSVASNSIDILNETVDGGASVPVNATINASITSKGEEVVTEYKSFTADTTSTKKRVYLALSQATTAASADGSTAAVYSASPTNTSPITVYGSLLSVDILGPSSGTPAVGSFAVTGTANANAAWAANDLEVAITYNVKASNALSITTPAPAEVTPAANADATIVVENVGEATVEGVAFHNDEDYGDVVLEDNYTVTYAPNATTSTQMDATVVIKKENESLAYIGTEHKGESQDVVITLTDGRVVTTTVKVTP